MIMEEKILVTRSSMPDFEEYMEEIQELWNTHWITNMGVKYQKLKGELKDFLKVENIDLVTNGHMALELAMQALDLNGEVITTPFTFASTTHAIIRNGLTPVFCDIKLADYTIDEAKIERLITDKTSAIVPVHVYGNICNIEAIEKIAQKYNLKVIYDAAHAFGETYKGKGIGSFGDISCFSFHATKVFNTIEGGAICFNESHLKHTFDILKDFGINGEQVEAVGTNAKMNEFCAAMGICNLRHIDREIEKRKQVVERYNMNLSGLKGIILNKIPAEIKTNYAYYPILINKEEFGASRDEVKNILDEHGINARKYFYPLTNRFSYVEDANKNDTPVAQMVSENILTLPLYSDLPIEKVDYICEILSEIGKNR